MSLPLGLLKKFGRIANDMRYLSLLAFLSPFPYHVRWCYAFDLFNHPSPTIERGVRNRHNDGIVHNQSHDRRTFLEDSFKLATMPSATLASIMIPSQAAMAADATASLKVTPLAHTFITSSGTAKPIRENDATRFFTNARVVYIFEGKGGESSTLSQEVVDLTVKRKSECGPGVTPGTVQRLASGSVDAVVAKARQLPEGDVLLVGPIPSVGTAGDGRVLAKTAASLESFVGGKIGGGVISVLLDGPREGLKLVESGFPSSELLWYSLPSKS